MDFILLFLRVFLFAVFSLAAIGKFLDFEGAKKSVQDFGTPADLAKTFAILIPVAELIFAVSLLFTSTAWLGAIGVLGFLLIFSAGMISQILRGNAPDCHCFGAIHSEPVSPKSLFRNAFFIIPAFFLVLRGRENQGLSFLDMTNEFAMQFVFGLAILSLLVAVLFYLRKISKQQDQIMRRIDILELSSQSESEVKRDDVTSPLDALPIGAFAPEFTLENAKNGREVSLEHLVMQGKPILLFFVTPNCVPCGELLPEILEWNEELGKDYNFVFVSNGEKKANLDKFGEKFDFVLLQKEREVSELFFARWTPSVLVINADGLIASRPAVGDIAIRELIERIKSERTKDFFIISDKNSFGAERPPKIGEKIPEFTLKDITGKEFSSKNFRNRKTLVTFWSTTCPHCNAMLEELRNWDKTKGLDAPDLLVFSDGEPESHSNLGLNSPVLLDKDYKISEKIGMFGTPSAVLVNENGKIVSETAIGAGNIWALVGKRN